MPFVPAVNTVKVDLNYDLDAQHIDNTLWFKKRTGSPDITTMLDLAASINDFWVLNLMPYCSQDCTYVGCTVTDQTTETSPAVSVPVVPVPGGTAIEAAPNSVAFVITFLTGGRGKSSRGRNYFPAVPNNVLLNNTVDGDWAANVLVGYQAILGGPFDADWEWSVVSHFTLGAPRATALIQPVIGARYSDLIVDSQRRRLPGRGS